MTGTAADVLAVALEQRGYRETPTNRTKFSAELDDVFGPVTLGSGAKVFRNTAITATRGMEWCAVFCAWSFWKATGELPPLPDGGFYTPSDVNAWRRQDRLVTSPEPGDFVYYRRWVSKAGVWQWEAYHVGLVTEVNGSRFSSIEGNTSPSSVVNPDGGGVFQFGRVAGVIGDAGDRPIATPGILFARPEYALPPDQNVIPSEGLVFKLATVRLPDGTFASAKFRATIDTDGRARELVWLEDDNRVGRCHDLPTVELDMNQVFVCSVDRIPVGDAGFQAFTGRDWARWDFLASGGN